MIFNRFLQNEMAKEWPKNDHICQKHSNYIVQKNYQHIAVMRLSAMGDVAMTVPVLRAFVKQYPEIKITVSFPTFFQTFFRGNSQSFFL